MTFENLPVTLRKALIGGLFTVGVVGSVATGEPAADISGVSNEVRVSLDANNPDAAFDAFVLVESDATVASGTGQIGLSITIDGDATGGVSAQLTSSSGETQAVDIVDAQAQGSARIGIDAFNSCGGTSCEESLSVDFFLEGEGPVNFSFSLDALASTEADSGTGNISFEIN